MDKIKIEIEFYNNGKNFNQILDINKIYQFDCSNNNFVINVNEHTNKLKNSLNNDFLNNIIQFINYNKYYSKPSGFISSFDNFNYILHKISFYTEDKSYYLNCNFIEDNKDLIIESKLNVYILFSSVNYNFESNKKLYNGTLNNIVVNRKVKLSDNDNLKVSQVITIILQYIFY